MTNLVFDEYAEMCITHRDIHDLDVAAVIHEIQKYVEGELCWNGERLS